MSSAGPISFDFGGRQFSYASVDELVAAAEHLERQIRRYWELNRSQIGSLPHKVGYLAEQLALIAAHYDAAEAALAQTDAKIASHMAELDRLFGELGD